ncbi:MAG: IS200/IS605 family element transposase accessory protein TnpB [Aquificae bacterium]|nr:IS200/IS605 family element transposase accessory protein TnpB [Aquificota bacterium]
MERQIEDLENKYIKKLLDYCLENKIGTVVIGDVKGIREKAKYNKNANRKIHLIWRFRKLIEKIKNKLSAYGVKVVEVSERFSTQLCPVCGQKNKTNNRNYKCSKCGFKFHRDFVGSLGIARNFFNLKLKRGFIFENKLKEKFKLIVFRVDVKKHEVIKRETYIGGGLEPPRRRDRHALLPAKGSNSSASFNNAFRG